MSARDPRAVIVYIVILSAVLAGFFFFMQAGRL